MTTKTKQADAMLIVRGLMPYLVAFPAAGRLLRISLTGRGLTASVADDLGLTNDAIPFSLALGTLQVEGASGGPGQTSVLVGPLRYQLQIPPSGRLVRVRASSGGAVDVSFEDDPTRTQDPVAFAQAFRSLRVEPIVDQNDPFGPYRP